MHRFQPSRHRVRRSLAAPAAIAVVAAVLSGCGSSTHSSSPTTSAGGGGATKAGCPSGTAPGATASQVTVAITVVNISGGSLTNATVGVPTVQVQKADWNLVADSINKAGGAGCRKLALQFYNVNPLDATAAQQVCLTIAASQPYIVLDTGSLTDVGASDCIPAHKVPLASQYLTQDQLTKYSPYYLQTGDIPNDTLRNGILGLKQLGYFSAAKGFSKLGLLYHTCTPALLTAQQAALTAAGVPDSKIVTYNLGCPAGQVDTAASMEQAVLSFKNAGVSDVNEVGVNDWAIFTQVAQQQNFKPHYVFDDNAMTINNQTTGADAPNPANLNGAVDVVTGTASGEQSTPGYVPSGGTAKCNALFAAVGQPTVFKQQDGYGGVACDSLWFVQALLDHSSKLGAATLVSAMHSAGTIDFSYPEAPIDFSAAPAGAAYGVGYWRADDYVGSCSCWQVPNPTFHPPFK